MDYDKATSLTGMFFEQASRLADRPFLWRKRDKRWVSQSWAEVAGQVNLLARGLQALGVVAGERVMLVAENRPEWLIADLAIMAAGAVTVPGYTTSTARDYVHLLNNSGAGLVIVSGRPLAERVLRAALNADHAVLVVAMEDLGLMQDPGVTLRQWDDVMALGAAHEDMVAEQVAATRRGDLACVIYTSGTGGAPKGVMLSHGSILSNCMGAYHLLLEIGLKDEVFLSFLPLSHSYEHTAGQFFPISIGAQIYYAEGLEQLSANMAEARPTLMTAVPRLYEIMRARILKGMERQGGLKARLFAAAVRLGGRRVEGTASMADRLANPLLDQLVRRKVAARFGGRLKALVSGGAPLNYEVGLFFSALGVRILQGYGQTETSPVISCNPPRRVRLHSVGPAVKGVEVRIAGDGEICVRGELVMLGYWGDEAATRAALRDGWLHTGDIGRLDADGYIYITDRKRDLIVNSGGDNISPQRVEGLLTLEPALAQAMVYGDRRPHLVALLVPDPEYALTWAHAHGKPENLEALVVDADFRRHVAEAVERVNRDLSPIEKVRRFLLTAQAFTTDNEMCTPTLKIRRHVIVKQYGAALNALYDDRRS